MKVVAISIDNTRTSGNVGSMVKSKDWEFDIYLDVNQDFKRAMNIGFCPYTFLIDKTGKIVWQKNAYAEGDEDKLFEMIKKTITDKY